jgi:hypothetical protein
MKGKILFVTGGLVGYVLGARAGRKRYEQIRSAVSKVWEKPAIQNQVHQAQDFAADKAAEVPDVLISGATKLVSSLIKRARSNSNASSHSNGSSGTSGSSSGKTSGTSGSSTAATTADGQPVVVKTTETRASTPTAEDAAE